MNRRKEYVVMKIYAAIFIIATIIIGIRTIVCYEPYGEAIGMTLRLSKLEIGLILLIQIITLGFAYRAFLLTKKNKIRFSHSEKKIHISNNKMHIFMLVVLLAQLLFSIKSGNGRLGQEQEVSSGLSSIMNMLNVRAFFPIYYFCCRGGKKYWINVIIFCIWQIICGWTSFVLALAFYELYIILREGKYKTLSQLSKNFYLFLSSGLLVLGGLMYSVMFRIKEYFRYGFDGGMLPFSEGLSRLVSRFTNFPVSLVGIQEHQKIVELGKLQNNWYTEVLLTFRPLIPGMIWHGKAELRSYGNIVLQALYPKLGAGTSTGYLCWAYWGNLLETDLIMFVFYIVVLVIFVYISKRIIYAFEVDEGLLDFLYFELIFKVFNGSVMESVFGYGYIGLVYVMPIMYLLGIIKIERRYR